MATTQFRQAWPGRAPIIKATYAPPRLNPVSDLDRLLDLFEVIAGKIISA